ncbi:unnamed protein product [Lampetra planeri]
MLTGSATPDIRRAAASETERSWQFRRSDGIGACSGGRDSVISARYERGTGPPKALACVGGRRLAVAAAPPSLFSSVGALLQLTEWASDRARRVPERNNPRMSLG